MYKENLLFCIGVLVYGMPFLGIPLSWQEVLQFVLGACVAVLAFGYRLERRRTMRDEASVVHVEHNPRERIL
jgi:hypothetical protein